MIPTALPQSEWWNLLDALPTPACFIDADQRYRFVNKAYELWGLRKRADIVGRPIEDILGSTAAVAVDTYVSAALAGATIHFESSIPYKRVGARRMKVTYSAVRDPEGAVAGFFAFLEDATDRHEAEAGISAALEGIGDGFVAINNQYCFTYVNSGAARFYNMPREQMVGRRIDDLFPGSMASPAGQMLIEVMESRVPQRKEMPSAGAPGRNFLMDIVPTTTGGVAVVIQDTTEVPGVPGRPAQLPKGMIAIVKPPAQASA